MIREILKDCFECPHAEWCIGVICLLAIGRTLDQRCAEVGTDEVRATHTARLGEILRDYELILKRER